MEERSVGGKEKKYVLYTVVNDEKGRTGCGVWVVRILLGSLLFVALAVVPYVSLKLAQDGERTLVVFQPIPVHNRTRSHHYRGESFSTNAHGPPSSHMPGKNLGTHGLQSASLVRENFTTEVLKNKQGTNSMSNTTIVTLNESAVTIALLEDLNNATQPNDQSNDTNSTTSADKVIISSTPLSSASEIDEVKTEESNQTSDEGRPSLSLVVIKISPSTNENVTAGPLVIEAEVKTEQHLKGISLPNATGSVDMIDKERTTYTESPVEKTSILLKVLKVATVPVEVTLTTTSRPVQKFSSKKKSFVAHKLAYVATASSGNHVGGLCVWKTNKNVTNWSYFYDNIPIEFQSHQDTTDHEMRAILTAERLWADQWYDYHVVIRSHHPSIKGSQHPTRILVANELDQKSEEHFTYELEYRLGRDDTLVKIAYCLARLHKNFDHWFKEFQNNVDELLGNQDWSVAKTKNHIKIPQELFTTDTKPERDEEFGDLNSLAFN